MKKALKIIAVVLVVLVVVCLLLYNVATSSTFITSVVLPKVSSSTGMTMSAESVYVSLLGSKVTLRDFKLRKDESMSISLPTLVCSYSFWDIIARKYKINELLLENAVIELAKTPPAKEPSPETTKQKDSTSEKKSEKKPILIDINNLNIKNLQFAYRDGLGDDKKTISINGFNLAIPSLANQKESEIKANAKINVVSGRSVKLDKVELDLQLTTILDAFLMPEKLVGAIRLNNITGVVDKAKLNEESISLNLDCLNDNDMMTIRKIVLSVFPGADGQSSISLNGTFKQSDTSLDLNYQINPLSSKALNLAGALAGNYSFGSTSVIGKGHISFKNNAIQTQNDINVIDFTLKTPTLAVPAKGKWKIALSNDANVDMKAKSAILRKLFFGIDQAGKNLLAVKTSKPADISWADPDKIANQDLELTVALNQFDLKTINSFIPPANKTKIKDGTVSVNLNIFTSKAEEQIKAHGAINVDNLDIATDKMTVGDIALIETFDVSVKKLDMISTKQCDLELKQGKNLIATLHANGHYSLKQKKGDKQINLVVHNSSLKPFLPQKEAVEKAFSIVSPWLTSLNTHVDFDLLSQTANVTKMELKLTERQKETVVLRQNKQLPLSWRNGFVWQTSPLNYTLLVHDFALKATNAFIPQATNFEIQNGALSAELNFVNKKIPDDLSANGTIDVKNLAYRQKKQVIESLNTKLDFAVDKSEQKIVIGKTIINLSHDKKLLAHLALDGNLSMPFDKGKSTLNLKSDKMMLKEIQEVLKGRAAPGGKPEVAQERAEKPASTSEKPKSDKASKSPLAGMDIVTNLDLKNLTYSEKILVFVKGVVTVADSAVTTKPMTITLNKTPIKLDAFFSMKNPLLYEYKIGTNFQKLDLKNLINAFAKKTNEKAGGVIDSFSLSAQGKGVKPEEIEHYLSGSLKSTYSDLSIPCVKGDQMEAARWFYVPVEMLANLKEIVPSFTMPEELQTTIDQISKILNSDQYNLDFDKGVFDATIKNGRAYFDNVQFTGSPIEKLRFDGSVPLNPEKELSVTSSLTLHSLTLPVSITGPMKKPKPDYAKIVTLLLTKNAKTLLDKDKMKKLFSKDGLKNLLDPNKKKKDDSAPPKQDKKKNIENELIEKGAEKLLDLFGN